MLYRILFEVGNLFSRIVAQRDPAVYNLRPQDPSGSDHSPDGSYDLMGTIRRNSNPKSRNQRIEFFGVNIKILYCLSDYFGIQLLFLHQSI
jgi:hypothetical protein